MSMSRILQRVKNSVQRRPLLFNSMMYGTFYTAAEFAQQSYVRIFKLSDSSTSMGRIDESALSRANENVAPLLLWVRKFDESLGLLDQTPSDTYNWAQLKRYAIYGCFLAGPVLHGWYRQLDAFFAGKSMKIVLTKLFADQFILTPPLITMFFVSMSLMEGRTDILSECRIKFLQTFMTSCMYWLPMQFINFLLVPPALRVTFVSIAAFCWVNILCYLKSIPLAESDQKTREL